MLKVSGAEPADPAAIGQLYDIVEALAIGEGFLPLTLRDRRRLSQRLCHRNESQAGVDHRHDGTLVDHEPRGARGVIGHEMSHIKNYDVRLLLIVSTLIGMAGLLASLIWRSALFMRGGRGRQGGQLMLIVFAVGLLMGIVALIFGPSCVSLSRRESPSPM